MGLDIRIPLGLIFLAIGALLTLFGIFSNGDAALYARSMNINLNLFWGGIMFAFGAIMFFVGRRQRWQDDPMNPRPWEKKPPAGLHH